MSKKNSPTVTDIVTPSVVANINSTEYQLCFDFNAMASAEQLTGLNLLRALDFKNINTVTFRALLYAALLHYQPDTTLESAGSLVTAATAPDLMNKVVKAYIVSQPEEDEDLKNVQTPEKN